MNPFDILTITILAYGLIRGIFRGLVREISSIIGVLGGFYAAYTYYPDVAQMISPVASRWISNSSTINILSYLVIFTIVVVIVSILAVIIKYLLNIAYLGWVDRVCGAFFGLIKSGLVICVLFIVFTSFSPHGAPLIKKAKLSPYIAAGSEVMAKVVSKEMKDRFKLNIEELKKFWKAR
jgi:membrane protein required for colicin V production